jgi:hypothetical protein
MCKPLRSVREITRKALRCEESALMQCCTFAGGQDAAGEHQIFHHVVAHEAAQHQRARHVGDEPPVHFTHRQLGVGNPTHPFSILRSASRSHLATSDGNRAHQATVPPNTGDAARRAQKNWCSWRLQLPTGDQHDPSTIKKPASTNQPQAGISSSANLHQRSKVTSTAASAAALPTGCGSIAIAAASVSKSSRCAKNTPSASCATPMTRIS